MQNFNGKNVLVVGLGRSGIAAAKYLLTEGAIVTITDSKTEAELKNEINDLSAFASKLLHFRAPALQYYLGNNPPEIFAKSELIVLSPGVPLDTAGVKLARERGIAVVSEIEIVLRHIKGRIIGITGTNGKSTTTSLVGELLRFKGGNVWVGGNLGNPLAGSVEEASLADHVVLELSSYQLEITPGLKCHIAIWLNVTPDHLDRYASFENYVSAKARIGLNQTTGDFIIYNDDDPLVAKRVHSFKSVKMPFSVSRRLKKGAFYSGDTLCIAGLPSQPSTMEINIGGCHLFGIHNRENIAASVMAAAIEGVETEKIEEGIRAFNGLPHRLQFVRELKGVKYYDDSKGTNTGAVIRSIESFTSPIILIAGGRSKKTGYGALKNKVQGRVRRIAAIGEAAAEIKKELGDVVDVDICKTLEDAVKLASKTALPGDIVLLSPACSSFDMFKDYAERGRAFVQCVNELGEDDG